MNLNQLSIKKTSELLHQRKISALELTKSFISQAKKLNQKTNAYISISEEIALNQAKKADKRLASGDSHPLLGIPYCLKDTYATKHIVTTAGSSILSEFIPPYDATVYRTLNEAGSVLIGKNSQDSWGHGSTNENTDLLIAKNPWDLSRTPGGSSGGTAVALATDTALFGIGEDTGGSIRLPSSFCNVTGLKVTYGLVSRYGTIAYGSSLDTVGPMARSVYDCALVLNSIAGIDPHDATMCHQRREDYLRGLERGVKNQKIGIAAEFFGESVENEINVAVEQGIETLNHLGAEVIKVSLPIVNSAVAIYYLLAWSESSSNLARYDGIRYGRDRNLFTDESKRRILIGTFALSAGYYDAYYKKAQKARSIMINQFKETFNKVDLLIAPVSPSLPYKLGEVLDSEKDPLKIYLADALVCAVNLAGVPSLALPCGFSRSGLPIGMQMIGAMDSEKMLFRVGSAYQQVTDWHKKRPSLI